MLGNGVALSGAAVEVSSSKDTLVCGTGVMNFIHNVYSGPACSSLHI